MEGEPGIGKTWLLSELRREAEERGHLVLAGSAAEFERDLPFAVWVDALDAYVASQDLDAESLTAVLRSTGAGSGDERHRVHRALRTLLEEIAERKPLVLVLDDLHWSDPASIEVLAALLRRGTTARVLLALGFRSGKAPAKLIAALAGATIIDLGPLSETECARLVGDGHDAAAIYAQSGGNPFYTLQLAQAAELPSRSSTGDRLARDAGVPRVVAATIVEQLESLTADARSLVNAGAIAGDPFEPELAYAIAELSPDVGVVALDELLDARLLQTTDVPRRFAFRHPLVRRAVYETTKGGWRLAGHARAAQTLAAQGVTAAARAHHVEQSGVRGERAAIDVLLEAGDAIAPTAPAGAAHWYAAALRLMPDDDRPGRLDALVNLARMQQSTGDLARCATTLLEALELVEEEALWLRLTSACASCENFLGMHETAERRLVAALEALPDQHSHEAVAVLLQLATGAFFTADTERMCALARRALAAAHALGDPTLIGTSAAVLAHSCASAGLVAEARASADDAAGRLDRLSDEALAPWLDAISRLAWAEFLIERFDDSIRHAARGAAVVRATGQGQFAPLILSGQAMSATARGDLSAATALLEEAMEMATIAANDYLTSAVLTSVAHVVTATGDIESARRAAEQSVALVTVAERGHLPAMAGVRLALSMRELGASAADTEPMVALAGGWQLPVIPPTWRVLHHATLTRVELDAGRLEPATACAEAAESDAAALGLPLATAVAERARAAVLLAQGNADAAAALAMRSAGAAHDAGAPIEAARARVVAGAALAATGARDRAVELLRGAEREFDERGALRDRAEARRHLRRLGARTEPRGPSGAADGGLASLSRREREVAALITERKTNKEVAAELFLSEKTVETHLRNIFAKLGASSRVDVARAVERSLPSHR